MERRSKNHWILRSIDLDTSIKVLGNPRLFLCLLQINESRGVAKEKAGIIEESRLKN